MNLHAIVRPLITTVNPDVPATWQRSTGYTTGTDGTRTPTYASAPIRVQAQALSARDIAQLTDAGIALEPVMRSVHMFGDAQGLVRPQAKGGDLLTFDYAGTPRVWKVINVMETWPDWCRVAVALQGAA